MSSNSEFRHIVVNNNRFELGKFLAKLEPKIIDELLTDVPNGDALLFLVNAVCMANDEKILNQLLDKIVAKKIPVKFSQEFIYYVVRENNLKLLEIILEFSKKHTSQDFHAENLGEYLCEKSHETTLLKAVKRQNFELVKTLVEECGANVNTVDLRERSPVYIASGLDSIELLEFLESKGADLNKTCSNGDNPLQRACMLIKVKNIEFLLGKGFH